MQLLDLPIEVFSQIIDTAVAINGLEEANTYCYVCKNFDREITRAVFATRPLEKANLKEKCRYKRLYVKYLASWTINEYLNESHKPSHWLPNTIKQTVDFLLLERPDPLPQRENLIQQLCESIAVEIESRYALRIILSMRAQPKVKMFGKRKRRCKVQENAFAAAVCLRFKDITQRMTEDNVRSRETYFGDPLVLLATQGDLEMVTMIYEKWKHQHNNASYYIAVQAAATYSRHELLEDLLDPIHIPYWDALQEEWIYFISVLATAAIFGRLSTIQYLINRATNRGTFDRIPEYRRSDVGDNPKVYAYNTVLWRAGCANRPSIVLFALENGASPNVDRCGH